MTFSPEHLNRHLPVPAGTPTASWWIALSGGLDSCVLLHALAVLGLPVNLRALHINHQISPNASRWQAHCEELCATLGIAFTAVKVEVKNTGRGIEDAAREARYQVFGQYLQAGDYMFTAHHADDQAETLLLRLLRGTGPRGLAAMAQARPFAAGILYRPLLSFTRSQLEVYAEAHGLQWVTDESNSDDHYDRNYLRNQVIPLLRERWPAFTGKWQQTAELCAANEALVEELATQDLLLAGLQPELVGTSVSLNYLAGLSLGRRHNLLRNWLRGQGLSTPEQAHLKQFEQQILRGRQDAETRVDWGNVSLRVYRERVYALPLADLPQIPVAAPAFGQQMALGGGYQLLATPGSALNKSCLQADLPHLQIRFRQGGERCRPAGRAHSQTLKRLLQDYGVAPWLRESLPLVYSGEQLVAVADLWICEGYQTQGQGYRLKYTRFLQ